MTALGDPIPTGLVHGSCAYWPATQKGVLITGAAGTGKSDLTLRLIDRGWRLVSDDCVNIGVMDGAAVATAPAALAGKLAIAGLGILHFPEFGACTIGLSVQLSLDPPRFPLDRAVQSIGGIHLPAIHIVGQSASAPLRIELALQQAQT